MTKKDAPKSKSSGHFFLLIVVVTYIILSVFDPTGAANSLNISGHLLYEMLPILAFVVIFMAVAFYVVTPKSIKKCMGKGAGAKGWFLAVSTGILSHGPVYVWFPMLKDLRDHGMRNGLISVFLSNRSIKLPFLPMMVFYFGVVFVVVLTVYMIIFSILQGWLFDTLEGRGVVMDGSG